MCVSFPPDQNEAPCRLCESCFHVQPLAEFRRRKRGSEHRVRQCRRCHNEFERYRRAAARARLSKRQMARDLSRVRDASSSGRVKFICAELVRGYGGAEEFARAWIACLHGDLQRGGFSALRHLEATIRLIQHCEQDRPDYSQMSDEDLEAMLASLQYRGPVPVQPL
jgi:hypothetical protein